MKTYAIRVVDDNTVLGTFQWRPDGGFSYPDSAVADMAQIEVARQLRQGDLTVDELAKAFTQGWSNGYIKIGPA
jgi:hypothetical protein